MDKSFSMNDVFRDTLKSVRDDSESVVNCDDLAVVRASIVLGSAQYNLGQVELMEQANGLAKYSDEHMNEAKTGIVSGCVATYNAISSFNRIADQYDNRHLAQGIDLTRTPEEVEQLVKTCVDASDESKKYIPEDDRKFFNNLSVFVQSAGQSILPEPLQEQMEHKTLRERMSAQFNFGSNVSVGDGDKEARSIVD